MSCLIAAICLAFTPFGGFLPLFFLEMISEYYWQYSFYEIFFEMHWQLTTVVIVASALVTIFVLVGKAM